VAFTYDDTTPRGQVRLLIGDTDTVTAANQIFTDSEIDAFLSLEGNDVRMSAAAACESIAANQARSGVAYQTLNMRIDRSKIPDHFMKLAERHRTRATEFEVDEDFDHVDYVVDETGADLSEYSGDIIG